MGRNKAPRAPKKSVTRPLNNGKDAGKRPKSMDGTLKQRLSDTHMVPADIVREVRAAMAGPGELSARAAILQVAPTISVQTVRNWMQSPDTVKPAGRPLTLTPEVEARLVTAIKEHSDRGVPVSEGTVRAWVTSGVWCPYISCTRCRSPGSSR
jgi:hypothetical protein